MKHRFQRYRVGQRLFMLLLLTILLLGPASSDRMLLAATEPEEGVIYYLLTEDNEITIRYPRVMGGATVLSPRVYEVLMIEKVDRLNAIAGKYGAYWTHFTAVGPWFAAYEAAQRSSSWQGLYQALLEQARRGNKAGHEYAPHPHGYWDPRVSLNTLVWDAAKDGYVDSGGEYMSWTAGFRRLGTIADLESATGYLYDHKRRLMEITHRETVVERTGSWQFGHTVELMSMSLAALRMNDILANSDAHANLSQKGNAGATYSKSLYLTAEDSINFPATSASQYGTLEFTPTPSPIILYDSDTLSQLNAKVDQGVRAFTDADGRVKPGVHFIVGFTHAKNMMGAGGWESTEGGAFDTLDRHLAYVANRYVNVTHPTIRFARATDAVKHYLDTYSERLVAVRGDDEKRLSDRVVEYPVQVLGRATGQDTKVSVKPPIWWNALADIEQVQIRAGDRVLGEFHHFTSAYPDLVVQTDGERNLVMRVTLAPSTTNK